MAQPSRETPEQQGGVLLLIDAQADPTPLEVVPFAHLHYQRSNEAQEFLLLRSVASRDEKISDLNIGDLAT
jgi:hypothetical protein